MNTRFGICRLPVIPLRASATHRAEMISQVIFGQLYSITYEDEHWYKIKIMDDDYEGWIAKNQYQEISTQQVNKLKNQSYYLNMDVFTEAYYLIQKENMLLPFGAILHNWANGFFNIAEDFYEIKNANVVLPEINNFSKTVENIAKLFLNVPYLWGGKTHFGIDCSGFTQQVFKAFDLQLPRDAWQQAQKGTLVDFLETVQLGDLAFFDNDEGKITHVGILLNKQQIIHASGKVKINTIDNYGIISEQSNTYSHKLRIIKRMC